MSTDAENRPPEGYEQPPPPSQPTLAYSGPGYRYIGDDLWLVTAVDENTLPNMVRDLQRMMAWQQQQQARRPLSELTTREFLIRDNVKH